jgi:hypothetical protein
MVRRGLVVFVLALVFLFTLLIGSAARAKSQTFGKLVTGSDSTGGYAALARPRGGEEHRCAS